MAGCDQENMEAAPTNKSNSEELSDGKKVDINSNGIGAVKDEKRMPFKKRKESFYRLDSNSTDEVVQSSATATTEAGNGSSKDYDNHSLPLKKRSRIMAPLSGEEITKTVQCSSSTTTSMPLTKKRNEPYYLSDNNTADEIVQSSATATSTTEAGNGSSKDYDDHSLPFKKRSRIMAPLSGEEITKTVQCSSSATTSMPLTKKRNEPYYLSDNNTTDEIVQSNGGTTTVEVDGSDYLHDQSSMPFKKRSKMTTALLTAAAVQCNSCCTTNMPSIKKRSRNSRPHRAPESVNHYFRLTATSSSTSNSTTTVASPIESAIISTMQQHAGNDHAVKKTSCEKKPGKKEKLAPDPSQEFHDRMRQIAESHGCAGALVHFFSKEVTLSDVRQNQNRLLISDRDGKIRERLEQVIDNEEMKIVKKNKGTGLAVVLVDGAGKVYENIDLGYDEERKEVGEKYAWLKYLKCNRGFRIKGANYKEFIGNYNPKVGVDILHLWAFLVPRDNGDRQIWIGLMKEKKTEPEAQRERDDNPQISPRAVHDQIVAAPGSVVADKGKSLTGAEPLLTRAAAARLRMRQA